MSAPYGPVCPRCRGFIPSNDTPGAYPGALSRADNATEVCSPCGMEEAILLLAPKDTWPVFFHDWPEAETRDASNRAMGRIRAILEEVP